jgi:hypothetical protein
LNDYAIDLGGVAGSPRRGGGGKQNGFILFVDRGILPPPYCSFSNTKKQSYKAKLNRLKTNNKITKIKK